MKKKALIVCKILFKGGIVWSLRTLCFTIYFEILNLEGLPTRITASKVTTILLNMWILPIGDASVVEGLRITGLPHLVSEATAHFSNQDHICWRLRYICQLHLGVINYHH